MAIEIIPNQPVRFRDVEDPEVVACMGQEFSQLVNKTDETQFQIKSTSNVTNGDFTTDLTGWDVYLGVSGTAYIINESSIGECDGSATITPSGGTPGYTYSIDGGLNFQASILFDNLCDGSYTVIIKDSTGKEGSVSFDISTNLDCTLIGGDESDFAGIYEAEILNCYESDLMFVYEGEITNVNTFVITDPSVAALIPTGKRMAILDGDYVGIYEVLSATVSFAGSNITLTTSPFDIGDIGVQFNIAR